MPETPTPQEAAILATERLKVAERKKTDPAIGLLRDKAAIAAAQARLNKC